MGELVWGIWKYGGGIGSIEREEENGAGGGAWDKEVKEEETGVLGVILSFFNHLFVSAAAQSLQLCPTLCDPIDGGPPSSPVPGILQARTLEWVAISFSKAWKWKWSCSVVSDSSTPWTAAYQAPPSMGFSRQEYWSGVPLPSLLFVSVTLKC